MIDNFNFLFHYLEKENIIFDKSEFLFQIQSHPDYPSLLSIADTLSFFNIDNSAFRLDVKEIELLPNRFVTLLKEENNKKSLHFIEKKGIAYFYFKDKKLFEMSKSDFISRWDNIVLLLEKTESEKIKNKSNLNWILPILCVILFFMVIFQFEKKLNTNLFFMFPIIGFLCSIAALKDLFGAKSEIINKFCNITASTSCSSVIGSNKWKVFKFISFSDLSIVFFTAQFFGLSFMIISGNVNEFFAIQTILLLFSFPIILISLYYQKFVEKKWCPICLLIIAIIVLEIGYVVFIQKCFLVFSITSVIIYTFINVFTLLVWSAVKLVLTKQKELKEFELKSNRFQRNYELFKNTLLSQNTVLLPNTPLILGNKSSKTVITIITNPFCKYCEVVDKIANRILNKHKDSLQIQFKVDLFTQNEEYLIFFRNLIQLYFDKGESGFKEGLSYWFDKKNIKIWLDKYESETENMRINEIYNSQNDWCHNNEFNYTPAIFINSHEYPKIYDRENLEFFIPEFLDDDF